MNPNGQMVPLSGLEPIGQDIWDGSRVAPVSETPRHVQLSETKETKRSVRWQGLSQGRWALWSAFEMPKYARILQIEPCLTHFWTPCLKLSISPSEAESKAIKSSLMKSLNDMKAKHHKKWYVCGCVCFAHWELEDEEFGWWQGCCTGAAFVFISVLRTLPDHDRPIIHVILNVLLLLSPKVNHLHLIWDYETHWVQSSLTGVVNAEGRQLRKVHKGSNLFLIRTLSDAFEIWLWFFLVSFGGISLKQ